MDRTGVDRRPGIQFPVKPAVRAPRFAHLARSGPRQSLLTSSPRAVAAFVAVALLYGYDACFLDGHYGSAVWKLFQQIGSAFRF